MGCHKYQEKDNIRKIVYLKCHQNFICNLTSVLNIPMVKDKNSLKIFKEEQGEKEMNTFCKIMVLNTIWFCHSNRQGAQWNRM